MTREIADLGRLEGDILIYGGPYSNLQATEALLAEADRRGIPPGRRICTGDVVAYCADPLPTLALVRAEGGTVVAGNTERQLASDAEDCGCGFESGSACDLLSRGWYPHARARVAADPGARSWLGACPDIAVFTLGPRRAVVIHGGVTDIARFLWPSSPEADFTAELEALQAVAGPVDMVIAGHCGLAFHRRIGAVDWLNAGVIGMPANNGTPETRYLVLSGEGAEIAALSYDHAAAADAMRAAGLRQGYDRALETGWWPSQDILPPELRQASPRGDAPAPAT